MTIQDMTLGQFQEIYKVQKSDMDAEDKMTEMVAIMTGKTGKEVEEMSIPDFNTIAGAVTAFLKAPIPEKKPQRQLAGWQILYEPGKMTRGQYVTMMHFMGGDIVENAHLIMACLALDPKTKKHPADRHAQIADAMQDVVFSDIYPACLFFCQLFAASMTGLESYLARQLMARGMSPTMARQQIRTLMEGLAGSIMPNGSPTLKTSHLSNATSVTP
jgi:hypothetical protein